MWHIPDDEDVTAYPHISYTAGGIQVPEGGLTPLFDHDRYPPGLLPNVERTVHAPHPLSFYRPQVEAHGSMQARVRSMPPVQTASQAELRHVDQSESEYNLTIVHQRWMQAVTRESDAVLALQIFQIKLGLMKRQLRAAKADVRRAEANLKVAQEMCRNVCKEDDVEFTSAIEENDDFVKSDSE
ncbi:hypothetical protein SCP_1300540 [Sparassis crispa]|uniref:Uncharacterized protein n=1 Tax=Sparassis crispa TaxID=139825 RepID=A0A401H1H4_9APHY|nr:hypothetical protein SCP_1300540 [Sparassis crispa]GBE88239.1 hypothetical protein SCP_1300540 [Sparassis crispa]